MITVKIDPMTLDKPYTMVQVHSILRAGGIPVDDSGVVTGGKLIRNDRLEPGIITFMYTEEEAIE